MTHSNDLLSTLGIIPVTGDKPCGINIRYDDEFELLEEELSKQGSLIDRGQINWQKVSSAAVNLLSNKSKDLKVSCYLIRALYENDGFEGLAFGLKINQQLLENFWRDIFPEKNRARGNAYEWLISKFEPVFQDVEPELDCLDFLQQSLDSIKEIETFLNEKLSDNAPAIGHFRRSIDELLQPLIEQKKAEDSEKQIQEAKQDADVQSPVSNNIKKSNELTVKVNLKEPASVSNSNLNLSMESTSISVDSNISTTINNEKDRNKIVRQCHDAMRNLSSFALAENLDSPSAYAMNRFSTWMGINQLPIHTDGVTPLKPLPKDKINIYVNLFNNGNYHELIPQIEHSFSRAPFWLDSHRMVAQGLEALGMDESAQQVKEYLALFIRRFPTIIDLKFSDNSDFADQQTKQWIATEISATSDMPNMNMSDSDFDLNYDEVIGQADDLARTKQLKEAIQLFQNHILQSGNLKQKIFWKYYLARFCYDNGQQRLAVSLLHEIDRFLQKNRLEYWEPELLKNVIYLLIIIIKQLDLKPLKDVSSRKRIIDTDVEEYVEEKTVENNKHNDINLLYTRLCQLDPVLAMGVSF